MAVAACWMVNCDSIAVTFASFPSKRIKDMNGTNEQMGPRIVDDYFANIWVAFKTSASAI